MEHDRVLEPLRRKITVMLLLGTGVKTWAVRLVTPLGHPAVRKLSASGSKVVPGPLRNGATKITGSVAPVTVANI
jgi:hypothetical protein